MVYKSDFEGHPVYQQEDGRAGHPGIGKSLIIETVHLLVRNASFVVRYFKPRYESVTWHLYRINQMT